MKNCPVSTMKYAVNVMNQFVYSKDERKLALKAIHTYLSIFRQLATSGSVDLTVTTATIVGLRRAFPYAGTDVVPLEEHLNALFILSNTGSFTQRVTTLSLLQLVALGKGGSEGLRDRWYRALYKLLLISPKQISHVAHITGFFSMLHKALRLDHNKERIAAFVHRLLQRSLYFSESIICSILLLVGDVLQAHPDLKRLIMGSRRPPGPPDGERYDLKHRDPQYARAKSECLYTLGILARHSHPSVVKLAVTLLFDEEMIFDSHPVDELTLVNFLQMFVDAKSHAKRGTEDETGNLESAGKTGVPVFRRAVQRANVPSASDPYFINAAAQQVDVSALFLHRYAVQRQLFIDGLSRDRSTWGNASGEADVALRVSDVDASLFGPSGMLAEPEDRKGEGAKDVEVKRGRKKDVRKMSKAKDDVELDEDVPSTDDEDGVGEDDFFDADDSDSGLEWGSGGEGTDGDDDGEDDEGDDDETALGGRGDTNGGDEGEDLAEVLEAHRSAASKKRKRENAWLERAAGTRDVTLPGRKSFRGERR
ncbi:unnamed protein product [Trypanosoma congolense IL3000]|uniref:WGS project CAEQ00000000 data, annotated contig 2215 n=1 Tax=Trypanosoma congolense (strain IL3000) TaxID=1068625 RepID=F9WCD4_TRYCI|nr:unnamed protein product [Trypanosoma congolense IL3000]